MTFDEEKCWFLLTFNSVLQQFLFCSNCWCDTEKGNCFPYASSSPLRITSPRCSLPREILGSTSSVNCFLSINNARYLLIRWFRLLNGHWSACDADRLVFQAIYLMSQNNRPTTARSPDVTTGSTTGRSKKQGGFISIDPIKAVFRKFSQ